MVREREWKTNESPLVKIGFLVNAVFKKQTPSEITLDVRKATHNLPRLY